MNVHEYQAKALLREFGVPVPEGRLATTRTLMRIFSAFCRLRVRLSSAPSTIVTFFFPKGARNTKIS